MKKGIRLDWCRKGLHEMIPENIWIRPNDGARYCRACQKSCKQSIQQPKLYAIKFTEEVWVPFVTRAAILNQNPAHVLESLVKDYSNSKSTFKEV
jgi:hypothetical protein